MNERFTHYFETTSRIDENCIALVQLKKRIQGSNNLAWLALAEVQNILESVSLPESGIEASQRVDLAEQAISKLDEVTEQHRDLLGQCISSLRATSEAIADDLDLIEKMSEEKEALGFQDDFRSASKNVMDEFRKPSTELDEAEELQGLMRQYRQELKAVA